MLEIRDLSKNYGRKEALKTFNYTFEDGIYGMLGANGAGKSTLMNLITDNINDPRGIIVQNNCYFLRRSAANCSSSPHGSFSTVYQTSFITIYGAATWITIVLPSGRTALQRT